MSRLKCILVGAVLSLVAVLVPVVAGEGLAGKWDVVWDTEGGIRTQQWTISTEEDSVLFKIDSNEYQGSVEDGRFEFSGEFYAAEAGYKDELTVEGSLKDGELSGKATWGQYAMTFKATRAN